MCCSLVKYLSRLSQQERTGSMMSVSSTQDSPPLLFSPLLCLCVCVFVYECVFVSHLNERLSAVMVPRTFWAHAYSTPPWRSWQLSPVPSSPTEGTRRSGHMGRPEKQTDYLSWCLLTVTYYIPQQIAVSHTHRLVWHAIAFTFCSSSSCFFPVHIESTTDVQGSEMCCKILYFGGQIWEVCLHATL